LKPRDRAAIQRERAIVRRLLSSFEAYKVRATWAIVGHLLLKEASWAGQRVHPDFPRPVTRSEARDWFFQLPRTPNDTAWYGRDLVEWIKSAEPPQEIGSHSFCHLPYDPDRTYRAAIEADLAVARRLHAAAGLPFDAFVFPRNHVGYRKAVGAAGICVYRGHTPGRYKRLWPSKVQRVLRLLTFLLAIPQQAVTATIDDVGLVNVPGSMLLLSRDGLRRFVPLRNLLTMATAGLDRAVRDGAIFHLWFHPSNLVYHTDKQFALLESILCYARQLCDQGKLEILTMGDIGRRVQDPI
jgi:hypothetical protein